VVATLTVLVLLSAAVLGSSLELRRSSSDARNVIAARAAAQAGLDVATWRLNQKSTLLTDVTCLAPDLSAVPPTLGNGRFCPPVSSATTPPGLDGASYTYWISKVLGISSTDTCGGLPVTFNATIRQRCIVSVGSANGVTRRIALLSTSQKNAITQTPTSVYALNESLGWRECKPAYDPNNPDAGC
jgi:hypothetical protein